MKKLLIYSSKHGNSQKVALTFEDVFVVKHISDPFNIQDYDLILFVVSTYGDEELPLDFEDFLINILVKNKKFIICELGNYFGYDEFTWGVVKIIKFQLETLGWEEFFSSLSLDSFCEVDTQSLLLWKDKLYAFLKS